MNEHDVEPPISRLARRASPGRAASTAAATCRQNRTGSLSPSSKESQATAIRSPRTHSASSVDFPNPAGAQTSTTSRPIVVRSRCTNRGRATRPSRSRGTVIFVANSGSATLNRRARIPVVAADRLEVKTLTTTPPSTPNVDLLGRPNRRRRPRPTVHPTSAAVRAVA